MNDSMAPYRVRLLTNSLDIGRLAPTTLRHPKTTTAALALFTLGLLLDALTTNALIAQPGFVEVNPLVDFAFRHAGLLGIAGYKTLLVTTAIGVVTWTKLLRAEAAANLCFIGIGTMWLLAGIHNTLLVI